MRLGSVPEFEDKRVAIEDLLDGSALNAFAASVNESNFGEARCVRRFDVLLDDRRDVARHEGVKVEAVFDRDVHGETQT